MPANNANGKSVTIDRHPMLEAAGLPPEYDALADDLLGESPLETHVKLLKVRFAQAIQEDFGSVRIEKIEAPLTRFALKASFDLLVAVRRATGEAGFDTTLRVLNVIHLEMIKEIVAARVARQMAGGAPSRQATLDEDDNDSGPTAAPASGPGRGDDDASSAADQDADDFAARVAKLLAGMRKPADDDVMVA